MFGKYLDLDCPFRSCTVFRVIMRETKALRVIKVIFRTEERKLLFCKSSSLLCQLSCLLECERIVSKNNWLTTPGGNFDKSFQSN